MKRLPKILICLFFLLQGTYAADAMNLRIAATDPDGHGILCYLDNKRVLIVSGTPEQMGAAHGHLLAGVISNMMPRTTSLVGAGYALHQGRWFHDKIDNIYRRSAPHTPERFLREMRSMAKASGISERDAIRGNFLPELFHCSGVAVRNTASLDGRVVHARVLDYMRDIHLQKHAVLKVFIPDDGLPWLSVGYAGLIETVTAMNAKGLAIGELGGSSEGNWNGMPMTFLMREVAEKAGTVAEAIKIMRETPRTCEFYYVISDAGRNLAGIHATPDILEVFDPGQQDERLPPVPEDTIMFSSGNRAVVLSQRLHEHHGNIDPQTMIDIIKRPVAMRSNLHNAIFRPESGDLWFADAGRHTPACDEPYTRANLHELVAYYREHSLRTTKTREDPNQ